MNISDKLKSPDLAKDTEIELEALAWRARRAGCQEVEDAAVIVISALQGGYAKEPEAQEPIDYSLNNPVEQPG